MVRPGESVGGVSGGHDGGRCGGSGGCSGSIISIGTAIFKWKCTPYGLLLRTLSHVGLSNANCKFCLSLSWSRCSILIGSKIQSTTKEQPHRILCVLFLSGLCVMPPTVFVQSISWYSLFYPVLFPFVSFYISANRFSCSFTFFSLSLSLLLLFDFVKIYHNQNQVSTMKCEMRCNEHTKISLITLGEAKQNEIRRWTRSYKQFVVWIGRVPHGAKI